MTAVATSETATVYALPPPAVTPESTKISLSQCRLCGALTQFSESGLHDQYHRINDLHSPVCRQMVSLAAQHAAIEAGADDAPQTEPCTCGLVEMKREEATC